MARQDIAGLLTGMPTQRPDPSMGREQWAMAFGQQQADRVGQGLRGLTGATTVREQAGIADLKAQERISALATSQDPAELRQAAQLLQQRGDPAGAARAAAQAKAIEDKKKAATVQKAERSSLADFLELEYGDSGTNLRTAVMSGAVNASNIDKFIKQKEKANRTPKNVTYTDSTGEQQTQLVFMDSNGKTFDERGASIILPDNAQLTITGRTAEDVNTGISEFTDKEYRAVRDDILKARGNLKILEPMTIENMDKYLSYLGRATATVGAKLSSLSGLGGDEINKFVKDTIGVDLQEFAGEQSLMFGDLENYFNESRRAITGLAAPVKELEQLRKAILSGEISPAVAKAKIAQVIQREQDELDLNFNLLKSNGLDIKGYFKNKTGVLTELKPDVSNLTVSEQESKTVIDRLLDAAKSAQGAEQ